MTTPMPIIHPKYFLTPDDRRGILVVNGATAFSFVWTAFLTRLFQRVRLREWKPDDWLLVAAMFLDTIYSGLTFRLIDLGLGIPHQHIPADKLHQLSEGAFAAQILYVFTLFASKCSVLCLYLRLSPHGTPAKASWGLIAVCTAWLIMATILIAGPCNSLQAYTNPQNCSNRWPKWQAITAVDIITEVFIFGIAVQLLWGLQLRFCAKFTAILAFAVRLPVIAAAAVRLYYLRKRITGESYTAEYVIATQWQMGITILASVFTGLGPFLRPFSQDYVAGYRTSEYGRLSKKTAKGSVSTAIPLKSGHSVRSDSFLMQDLHPLDEYTRSGDEVRILGGIGPAKHPTSPRRDGKTRPEGDRSWMVISKKTEITQYNNSGALTIAMP